MFEKVILNDVVVQQNAGLSASTKGALAETEVTSTTFCIQGGHVPLAFRNIKVRELVDNIFSKLNKWENLF